MKVVVTRSSWIRRSACSASNLGIGTTVPPSRIVSSEKYPTALW